MTSTSCRVPSAVRTPRGVISVILSVTSDTSSRVTVRAQMPLSRMNRLANGG
jgi:hypothetical protein